MYWVVKSRLLRNFLRPSSQCMAILISFCFCLDCGLSRHVNQSADDNDRFAIIHADDRDDTIWYDNDRDEMVWGW